MKLILKTVFLCSFLNFDKAFSTIGCRSLQDSITLEDIPGGLVLEVISFIFTGILGCSIQQIEYEDKHVKLWLYTRENPENATLLDKQNPIYSLGMKTTTKILIHGWLGNASDCDIIKLKNEYLKAGDYNVIAVEWTKYSTKLYGESFCLLRKIAKTIGIYLCSVPNWSNNTLNSIHIVGHSLGGQMAGLIGQTVQTQCNKKLGRITGLDPAGPLFTFESKSNRLDSSDASFVDVIHSNGMGLGYYGPCGTVDFYPNCGTIQGGCTFKNINSIGDVITLRGPLRDILCHHFRAVDYMTESISSTGFKSVSCSITTPLLCIGDMIKPSYSIMGEHVPQNNTGRIYCLRANKSPPFALN